MHGFTLLALLSPLFSLLLQTNASRRASERPPSDSHRKWPHQSVHHDPMAAPPREPSEWATPGLHHQVKRPWRPALFLSKDRSLSGPILFSRDNNCDVSSFSSSPFRFILAHCFQWNNWRQLNTFLTTHLLSPHFFFFTRFLTVLQVFYSITTISSENLRFDIFMACLYVHLSLLPPSIDYSLCCQVLSVRASSGLSDEKHQQNRPDQFTPGGPHHLDQLWDRGGSL